MCHSVSSNNPLLILSHLACFCKAIDRYMYYTIDGYMYYTIDRYMYYTINRYMYYTIDRYMYYTIDRYMYYTIDRYMYYTIDRYMYYTIDRYTYYTCMCIKRVPLWKISKTRMPSDGNIRNTVLNHKLLQLTVYEIRNRTHSKPTSTHTQHIIYIEQSHKHYNLISIQQSYKSSYVIIFRYIHACCGPWSIDVHLINY